MCFCTLGSLHRDEVTEAIGGGLGGILGKYAVMVHWVTVEVPKVVFMVLLRRIYRSTVLKDSIGSAPVRTEETFQNNSSKKLYHILSKFRQLVKIFNG